MEASPTTIDYCPSCGEWDKVIDEYTCWCLDCSPQVRNKIPCNTCGEYILISNGTTICADCKLEQWLAKYTDDLEFLIVYKGYSFSRARATVARIIRPVCKCCGKSIKGGTPGETLFCKANPRCHKMYRKYKKLMKDGMSAEDALREVTSVLHAHG